MIQPNAPLLSASQTPVGSNAPGRTTSSVQVDNFSRLLDNLSALSLSLDQAAAVNGKGLVQVVDQDAAAQAIASGKDGGKILPVVAFPLPEPMPTSPDGSAHTDIASDEDQEAPVGVAQTGVPIAPVIPLPLQHVPPPDITIPVDASAAARIAWHSFSGGALSRRLPAAETSPSGISADYVTAHSTLTSGQGSGPQQNDDIAALAQPARIPSTAVLSTTLAALQSGEQNRTLLAAQAGSRIHLATSTSASAMMATGPVPTILRTTPTDSMPATVQAATPHILPEAPIPSSGIAAPQMHPSDVQVEGKSSHAFRTAIKQDISAASLPSQGIEIELENSEPAPVSMAKTSTPSGAVLSTAPQTAPAAAILDTAAAAPVPAPDGPHDYETLVQRMAQAREVASPDTIQASLNHAQFGRISLHMRHEDGGMNVTMNTNDPTFAPAVQAAVAAAQANAGADMDNTRQHAGNPFTSQSGTSQNGDGILRQTPSDQNGSGGQSQGQEQPQTGPRASIRGNRPDSDPIQANSPRTPRTGGGIYA